MDFETSFKFQLHITIWKSGVYPLIEHYRTCLKQTRETFQISFDPYANTTSNKSEEGGQLTLLDTTSYNMIRVYLKDFLKECEILFVQLEKFLKKHPNIKFPIYKDSQMQILYTLWHHCLSSMGDLMRYMLMENALDKLQVDQEKEKEHNNIFEKAQHYYRKALIILPNDGRIYHQLGLIYMLKGSPLEALRFYMSRSYLNIILVYCTI